MSVPTQRPEPSASRLITHPEIDQRSPEWHNQRRGMVTASIVGRLISVRRLTATEVSCPSCEAPALEPCRSKRSSDAGAPIQKAHPERTEAAASLGKDEARVIEVATGDDTRSLAAHLAAERISGFTEETYVTRDMQKGIECEPLAADAYSAHYGVPVESCGFMVRDWGRFKLGFSPDGLVGDDGLIEIKTRGGKKQILTVVNDEVPPENMAQLQAGLLVSGRDWIDYVSYSGGLHLWTKRVLPDPRWFDAITRAVAACEDVIAAMVAAYTRGTAGMPMTERLAEEIVIYMDLTDTIAPNSDQLDAVDLLTGPRTFTISKVSKGAPDQPVNLHLAEFDRPWRPGKSMRRVLVACWGPDASTYIGRRVTLYCDPTVRFGGETVGGTRISHLSHIDKPKTVVLLVTRGKSAPFKVQPLVEEAPTTGGVTPDQLGRLAQAMKDAGITTRDSWLKYLGGVIGRTVGGSKELTQDEAERVLDDLQPTT